MSDSAAPLPLAQRVRDDGASGDLWTPNPEFLVDPSDIRLTTVTLANPYLVTENDNVSMTLDYDLAFGTLRSITGYARSCTDNLDDCAGDPEAAGLREGRHARIRSMVLRKSSFSCTGPAPIDGLVGIYYFDADAADDFDEFIPLRNPNPRNDSFRVTRNSKCHFWSGDPALRRTVERYRRAAPEPRRTAE